MKTSPSETLLRLLAVVGPTAGGKTALSLALAERLGGEILACDSMQVYRGMDIGTAKPTPEETARAPHHLIDLCDADESFSVASYVTAARACICEVSARGKLPIFCGGTGLYLDGVLLGGSFEDTPHDDAVRARLQGEAAEPGGAAALYRRLCAVDPDSAAVIHPNNVKRVVRALEIYEVCGKPKSVLDTQSRTRGMQYDATVIGLRYRSRKLLGARIDRRVDDMMAAGLLDEVRALHAAGVFEKNTTAAQAIGYKELLGALGGEVEPEEAVNRLKLATRHYAKRQMTWFGAKDYVHWINADTGEGSMRPFDDIVREAVEYVSRRDDRLTVER